MATVSFSESGQRRVRKFEARAVLNGFFAGAVTTSSSYDFIVPCDGRILAVNVYAATAGSGTGSTDLILAKNGVDITSSVFSLAAANDGYFTDGELSDRSVHAGDVLGLYVDDVPTTSAHADISFTIVIG